MTMQKALPLFLISTLLFAQECKPATQPAGNAPPKAAPPIPASVSADRRTPVVVAVHNILPAVVNIQTEATMRQREYDPFFGFFGTDRTYKTQALGSGFVWQANGIIVTNAHVIEGASSITVNFQNGSQFPARVIGVDPDSDVAVLRVDAKNLPTVPIGTSSDLMIGETVIAVGNPFGLSGSVTTGVISATGRSVPSKEEGRTFTDFIQTDASINPGNSGGPLLNIEGRVIGINTAIYADAQGIGFAIPVDRAKKIVQDLLRYGTVKSAWIGAVTATVTPEEAHRLGLSATRGALVTRVFGDSPADRAGLHPGDVITQVSGEQVDSREAFSTRTATVASGRPLPLTVQRGNGSMTINVTPSDPPRDLGLTILQSVSGITAAESGNGVAVTAVAHGSRAESIGLQPGDAIVAVNGEEVQSLSELNDRIAKGSERSSIVLSIARGRFIYTLTFPM